MSVYVNSQTFVTFDIFQREVVKNNKQQLLSVYVLKLNILLRCWKCCKQDSVIHWILHTLNLVKLKRVIAGQWTIQSCFRKRCPIITATSLTTRIRFTNPCNPWVNNLQMKIILWCQYVTWINLIINWKHAFATIIMVKIRVLNQLCIPIPKVWVYINLN